MHDSVLSLLGLCRKANRLAIGHDAALRTTLRGTAKLILLAIDVSPRLSREFERAARDHVIPILQLPYSMEDLGAAIGIKAGVFTINDEGFAKKITTLVKPDDGEEKSL